MFNRDSETRRAHHRAWHKTLYFWERGQRRYEPIVRIQLLLTSTLISLLPYAMNAPTYTENMHQQIRTDNWYVHACKLSACLARVIPAAVLGLSNVQ